RPGRFSESSGMEVFLSDTRPDYFRVLGIPLREGRDFSERDTQSSTPVAIVSEDFARHAWGDSSALGRRVSLNGAKGPYLTVVGVARSALTMGMSRQRPVLYRALGQATAVHDLTILARSNGDARTLAASIRSILRDMDSALPVYGVQSLA